MIVAAAALALLLAPGTYRQADLLTRKPLPVGSQLVVVAGKGGKMGFSINAIRALDSDQGFIAGTLSGPLPATWTQHGLSGDCRLRFEAVPGGLTVIEDRSFGDCGFPEGVTANGTYVPVPD